MNPGTQEAAGQRTSRVLYFDVLNVLACISVLFLHCNTMVHAWNPGKNWAAALAIETIFFFAVPIFFMLTGATLLRYRDRYDTQTFFRKRLLRIAVPFLAWSLIAFITANIVNDRWDTLNAWNPVSFANGILNNTIEVTYWFFFPLFAIYLALPVISLLKDQRSVLIYAAVAAFILQYCLPVIMKMLGTNWNPDFSMPALGGFLFYPVLGYLLATIDFAKKYRILLYTTAVLSLILKFGYTLYYSALIQDVDRTFFDYQVFTAALPAAAIFVWCKNTDFEWLRKHQNLLAKISGCSFGVYLLHNLVLQNIIFGFFAISPTSVVLRTAVPLLLYAFCVLAVLLLKQIPILRKIVP